MAKKYLIIVPYVFGLYYVLNFFSVNPSIFNMETFLKTVLVFGTIILILHLTAYIVLRDKTKAAIGTLFILFLFFSYGLLETAAVTLMSALITANMAKILLGIVSSVLLICIFYWFKKTDSEFKALSSFIAVFLVVLMVMPSYTLLQYSKGIRAAAVNHEVEKTPEKFDMNNPLPNIYHIVLDGYGREDVLRDYYNLNNADFIAYLKSKGFNVRDDCHTNYIWTQCSVASMLTMNYLQESKLDVNISGQLLSSMVKEAGVGKILSGYGYEYIEVASPVPTREGADFMYIYKEKTDIYKYMLYQTPLKYLYSYNSVTSNAEVYDLWRSRLLGYFMALEAVPDQHSGPTYTYCHFLMPHPPFVFDAEGKPVNPERPFSTNDFDKFLKSGGTEAEYRTCYVQQLLFTNQRLKQTIDKILASTERPTVIIISSDHGPRLLINEESKNKSQFQEALPIFFAYKVPAGDELIFDQVNSSVNIYRVIMNYYFGTHYALLQDRFYYSTWYNQLRFEDASNLINSYVQTDYPN